MKGVCSYIVKDLYVIFFWLRFKMRINVGSVMFKFRKDELESKRYFKKV